LRLSKEQEEHAKIMAEVLSDLLQVTMQRMVSSVPLSDLVRKVTSENSGSRLGELREMVESLLHTYGHEVDVCSAAVNVMVADVNLMEVECHRMRLEGASVRSVMNQAVSSGEGLGPARIEGYARGGHTLMLERDGNASFGDGGKFLKGQRSNGSLSNALERLHARRTRNQKDPPKRSASSLASITVSDQRFYNGQSSEAVGVHRVSALGEAQSFGSLHWISG